MQWPEIRRMHAAAVEELATTAERVQTDKWLVARAEGKWSPAEVVEHLNTTYAVVLDELAGGPGMRIRTKWWQRMLLHFTIRRRILLGRGFPRGARAPKELRPASAPPDQLAAIARFRSLGAQFDAAVASAVEGGRNLEVTHAYFGRSPAATGMLFAARHIEHHCKQLA